MNDLRICTTCRIHHYENCPDCAGFGKRLSRKSLEWVLVRAAEAHDPTLIPEGSVLSPCGTCKSTIAGVPEEVAS